MSVLPPSRFTELEQEIQAAAQPATHLERWFANEVALASFELERVRSNTSNTVAESRLNAAYSRAARNWSRARKELQLLQTARTNHRTRLHESLHPVAAAFPLADPARTPRPRPANLMVDHWIQQIGHQAIAESAQVGHSFQEGK
ncbi:MAG: hypothetical protein ACKV2U_31345 [Bryobacteraceae bacterium]